ncbi:hypothetical protein AMATHDRAFT_64376 [Amanita thiersii Skay4041]|uniref:Uncharacterized protein n=1 Tax=Amanita thiersii Skay4041 TaxID=703135 RepID=A0A2A9NHR2_9AGAR|nr:hypothetical protein AMATHDRAFT_64376 [Amanita thiersii Skay4041]
MHSNQRSPSSIRHPSNRCHRDYLPRQLRALIRFRAMFNHPLMDQTSQTCAS